MFVFSRDLCLSVSHPAVMLKVDHAQKETGVPFQLRELYKGNGHVSHLERVPPPDSTGE